MRYFTLILAWALTAAVGVGQQNATRLMVKDYPADHFSISVPAGWVEIPKSELDQMAANAREAVPNARPQPFNYGFQASIEATYPRFVIQLKTGRWSEDLFGKLPQLGAYKEETQRNLNSASAAMAAINLKIGTLSWDAKARTAWMRLQFSGEGGRVVEGLSGLHPTNVGSIQVNCYAEQPDFERVAPVFSDIVTSVRIDDQLKYRERGALSRTFDWFGGSGFAGAAGGIIAVLLIRILRRRKLDVKTARRIE